MSECPEFYGAKPRVNGDNNAVTLTPKCCSKRAGRSTFPHTYLDDQSWTEFPNNFFVKLKVITPAMQVKRLYLQILIRVM